MNTSINKIMKGIMIALLLSFLTACGGGDGVAVDATPNLTALTATAIQLAQESLDVITAVINGALGALAGTDIETLQTAFDGFINTLSSTSALTDADIKSVQNVLDDYVGTTDASAGALTAAQIQAAQEALDAARPLLP